MDLRKLKKLIDLVEESGITELEVTEGEEKVRIAKHVAGPAAVSYVAQPPAAQAAPAATVKAPAVPATSAPVAVSAAPAADLPPVWQRRKRR